MKKDNKQEDDRLPGPTAKPWLKADLSVVFHSWTRKLLNSPHLPGLGYRFSVLLGGFFLTLSALVGHKGPAPSVQPPHVAVIAPSLNLPVELNQRVEGWMERYLTEQRPAFEQYLAREGLYSGMIREALARKGMPQELVYLAAVESGFFPRATSKVAASGLWQFMSPTARAFGLRIDGWVDERRDPVQATDAALDYLQSLYDQFGSWYLAAAAYNAGPGRVARALETLDGDASRDQELYWDIVEHLPRETREYVPKMLAAALLAQAAEEYGFDVEPSQPLRYDRVWVPGGTSLRSVARAVGVEHSGMLDLNPHLLRGVTPPGDLYPIRVPRGSSPLVVASTGSRWQRFTVDD